MFRSAPLLKRSPTPKLSLSAPLRPRWCRLRAEPAISAKNENWYVWGWRTGRICRFRLSIARHTGQSWRNLYATRDRRRYSELDERRRSSESGAVSLLGPAGGVTSFNNRSGAVVPKNGDYTAEMVGAEEKRRRQESQRVRGRTQSPVRCETEYGRRRRHSETHLHAVRDANAARIRSGNESPSRSHYEVACGSRNSRVQRFQQL